MLRGTAHGHRAESGKSDDCRRPFIKFLPERLLSVIVRAMMAAKHRKILRGYVNVGFYQTRVQFTSL